SDWMQFTPIGVVAIVLGVLAVLSFANRHKLTEQGWANPRYQYERSKDSAPIGAAMQSAQTDPKSYRDEWRAEQNLKAQEDMVRWALGAMIAAWVGAAAAVYGFVFLRKNLAATLDAVKLAEKSNELQLSEFRAAHPPKLRIRNIDVKFELAAGTELSGQLYVLNSGEHDAIIFRGDESRINNHAGWLTPDVPRTAVMIHISKDRTLPRNWFVYDVLVRDPSRVQAEQNCRSTISPGQMICWTFTGGSLLLSQEQIDSIKSGKGWQLYVIGLIRFANKAEGLDSAAIHRTLFCYRYNHITDRFEKTEDPYYNYEA
ncbi:MAG: hypothetical protein HOP09_16730, partial [Hyphomicrobium sp.]|nr:hypothetical protein [Hyphomicrobium sp.]